jgi:hypothetical protein
MTVAPANTSSIIVAITGVLQDPSTYSVSGTTLTFSAAPPSGTSNISVRYLGIPASGVTTTAYRTVTNFTATAGQTSFSVPSYTVGYIDVYRNGVYLPTSDYTATTGTTVVLTNACTVGDTITTISFYVSSVLNAIPNTAGSVGSSNIVSGVTLTSPTISGGAITGLTSNLTFASGTNGIVFNNSGATINSTLNDYEYGTFNITYSGGGSSPSIVSQSNSYVKIGRSVTVSISTQVNLGSTSTTLGTISGFPFAFATNYATGTGREWYSTGKALEVVGGVSSTTATLVFYDNSASLTGITYLGIGVSFSYVTTF